MEIQKGAQWVCALFIGDALIPPRKVDRRSIFNIVHHNREPIFRFAHQ